LRIDGIMRRADVAQSLMGCGNMVSVDSNQIIRRRLRFCDAGSPVFGAWPRPRWLAATFSCILLRFSAAWCYTFNQFNERRVVFFCSRR
jgi:hypothetical protein